MAFNYNEYVTNYKKEKYDRIIVEVKKGKKELIKEYAENKGYKLSEYIKKLIEKDSEIEL